MSSKRGLRRRQCGKKIGHATHQQALAALFRTGDPAIRSRLGVYRCSNCGLFHIGHQVGSTLDEKYIGRGYVRPRYTK